MKKDTFDLLNELKSSSSNVEFQRRLSNGNLETVNENDLNLLKSKSSIAHAAGIFSQLNDEEKLQEALRLKELSNDLFKEGKYKEALESYLPILAAANLSDERSIDSLIIPTLCNMAACCLNLKQFSKVIQFCDQALLHRPNCLKAKIRKGKGLLHLQEYTSAISQLIEVKETLERTDHIRTEQSQQSLSEINQLLDRATSARNREAQRYKEQKMALKKAFQSKSPHKSKSTLEKLQRFIWNFILSVILFVQAIISRVFSFRTK
jgi:tetratricopeptide (TPR) repeat protein